MSRPSSVSSCSRFHRLTVMADDLFRRPEEQKRRPRQEAPTVLTDDKLAAQAGPTRLNIIGSEAAPSTALAAAAPTEAAAGAAQPSEIPNGEHAKKVQDLKDKIRDLEQDIKDAENKSLLLQQGLVVPGNPLREFNQKADLDAARQKRADSQKALEQASKDLAELQRRAN